MTVDHQQFISQIQAEPENHLHRLVYADWLEERGDNRCEILRAGVDVMKRVRPKTVRQDRTPPYERFLALVDFPLPIPPEKREYVDWLGVTRFPVIVTHGHHPGWWAWCLHTDPLQAVDFHEQVQFAKELKAKIRSLDSLAPGLLDPRIGLRADNP